MAGTLRLSNTGTGNGQSTITTAASGDTTYTLPSGGGTFVTTGSTQALTVAFASGTVSAPSITFLGDSNTGIYSPAADTIAFTEGGVEALRIDSSGRVGIGTTSPDTRLHVSVPSSTFTYLAKFDNPTKGTSLTFGSPASDTQFLLPAKAGDSVIRSETGNIVIGTNDDTKSILFGSQNSSRVAIDSSGRLLVGTSTSTENVRVGQKFACVTTGGSDNGGISLTTYGGTNSNIAPVFDFQRSRGTTDGSLTEVISGDRLGYIVFRGADGATFSDGAVIIGEADGDWTTSGDTTDSPGRLVFSTTADGASSPTERMRIANDGKIGFGTTTLTGKFNFDGSVFLFSQPSGAGNSTLKFNTSTGAVTYDTSSRLVKQNIEDCPYGLAELAQLKPRKYFRTDDQKVEIGFVADEVADVLPEFVPIGPKHIITKNEADTEEIPLGVNYEKLTAVLTKALQEAIGEIELLKARVAALESA